MSKASARKNGSLGYKAIIIHDDHPKVHTEVLGTQHKFNRALCEMEFYRAAPNYETREAAIAAAEMVIEHRKREHAISLWLYHNRDVNGVRRDRKDAIEALEADSAREMRRK